VIPSSAQDARHQPTMASEPFARVAFGARDRDFRDRQARLARFLFVGAAIVALGTFPFLPDGVDRVPIVIVGSVGLAVGLLLPALPWHRWPWWALLVPAVLGFVLLATAGRLSPGALEHYLALYSLSFVYIGLVAPPRVPVCFVPLAVLSFAIGDSQHLGDHVVNLATAAPVWALIGEVIANGLADRQEGERRRTAALTVAADTDALTGLANRRLFDRTLASVRPGDAVVLIDLDHFKPVNDRHGHPFGDDALRHLATAMRQIVRTGDCAARYGGDEFGMVLPGAGVSGAEVTIERVKALWEAIDGVTTFSAGIAIDYGCATDTLARADAALYAAKRKGRGRVAVG